VTLPGTWAVYFATTVALETAVLTPLFRSLPLRARVGWVLLANAFTHPLVFMLVFHAMTLGRVLALELFAVAAEALIYAYAGISGWLALGGSLLANGLSLGAGSLLGARICAWLDWL
jgi:hypothetical protein